MIIDEPLISLSDAVRKHLPPGHTGRPLHLSTVLRWVLDGVRAPGGQRVRLEAIRLGGRWMTSVEAIRRFTAALTPVLDHSFSPNIRTPGQRRRRSERAAAELDKLGI